MKGKLLQVFKILMVLALVINLVSTVRQSTVAYAESQREYYLEDEECNPPSDYDEECPEDDGWESETCIENCDEMSPEEDEWSEGVVEDNPDEEGEYVYADGDGGGGLPRLATPEVDIINSNQLVWNAIPNAASYLVYGNGVLVDTFEVEVPLSENPTLDLSEFFNTLGIGSHELEIWVRAIGDGINFSDSLSGGIIINAHSVCLEDRGSYGCDGDIPRIRPVEMTLTGDLLTWLLVPNASGYQLSVRRYLNDVYVESLEESVPLLGNPMFDLSHFTDRETIGSHRLVIEMYAIAGNVEFANSETRELSVSYTINGDTEEPPTSPTESTTSPATEPQSTSTESAPTSPAATLPAAGANTGFNTMLIGSGLLVSASLAGYVKSKKE